MQLKTSLKAVKKELKKLNQGAAGVFFVSIDDEKEEITITSQSKVKMVGAFEDYEAFKQKHKGSVFIIDDIPDNEDRWSDYAV